MRIFHRRAGRACIEALATAKGERPVEEPGSMSVPESMSFEQLCASLARSAALRLQEKAA